MRVSMLGEIHKWLAPFKRKYFITSGSDFCTDNISHGHKWKGSQGWHLVSCTTCHWQWHHLMYNKRFHLAVPLIGDIYSHLHWCCLCIACAILLGVYCIHTSHPLRVHTSQTRLWIFPYEPSDLYCIHVFSGSLCEPNFFQATSIYFWFCLRRPISGCVSLVLIPSHQAFFWKIR